jgi:hypothetical protein
MIGEQMATFASFSEIDEYCPFHFEPIETSHLIDLPASIADIWSNLSLDPESQIDFYDDFLYIHGCADCKTAATLGFKDLLKKQGVCAQCGTERVVDLMSRISLDSDAAKLPIESQFWPLHTFAQIRTAEGLERVEIKRGA